MQDLSVTLVQYSPAWHRVKENLAYLDKLLFTAKKSTDLIILPEMFTTGFTMASKELAEQMNSTTHSWMKAKALHYQAVICGSIIIEEKGKYFNRFLWVEPSGNTIYYDKRHLFRMADENKYFSEGNKKVIVEYKGWKIRPLICYDLRFPIWSRNATTKAKLDFDLLLFVANWPEVRVSAWNILLKARAIENLAYCAGVNRIGVDGKNIIYNGQTALYGPRGESLGTAETSEALVTVVLKKDELANYRNKFPANLDADSFAIDY